MSKYTNFGILLADHAKASELPSVLFTSNADLRMSVHHLVAMTPSDELGCDKVAAAVEEFSQMEDDQENNALAFQNIHAISDAFADRLKAGTDELHKVKDIVKSLVAAYDEKVAMRIAEDPVLAKVNGINTELTMDDVTWKYLDQIDEYELISLCNTAAGFKADTNITKMVVDSVINQMPCANQYNQVDMKVIKLDDEKFRAIVNNLHQAFPNESIECIAGMFRNILNLDTTCARVAVNSARAFLEGKTANKINHIMKNAVAYKDLIPYLTAESLDLAASTMAELDLHKQAMDAIANVNLYIASYYRNVMWKDAIMVPGPLCNPDNAEQYQKDGGTTTKLVHNHNKFFKNVNIPTKGVTSKFVLDNAKRLEEEFSSEALRHTAEINHAENEIKRASFIIATTNYLNSEKKNLSKEFAYQNNIEKFAASIYDGMASAPIEEKFYRAIFNAKYIGSIVPVIYQRISDAYVEYAKVTGNITKESCEELDIKVYADMISEYLVDQGVLVIG